MTDPVKFAETWEQIRTGSPDFVPPSFIDYLATYWMKIEKWWSNVYRQRRSVFENSDTNMLLEAWHHLLKGKLLEGKRNRRADHLIYTLMQKAIPYFQKWHRCQEAGFEGPDLEICRRMKVAE
ncbi:hypothetical protein BT96DRAFT_836017 [Gymnopus androsaceus JB14]|uniref:Uncharacterized protein n=1 Tax=Gymnopus androsaceus JB14 TaxID=1447944 RepID=A0A6A4GRZ7_9AGAR|nr:hypothetical protein BT96DRAFT_836017 [Gymnopus androsaceus JB14]